MPDKKPLRETLVLSLGLPRTGTASMCEALTQLGYKNVYHCLQTVAGERKGDWPILNRAADATFPNLPTYTGKPFTRANWDELFGPCEGITDAASMFAPQLIEAYPEAKVVLVIRDYDRWYKSMDEGIFGALWGRVVSFFVEIVEPFIGSVAGVACRKLCMRYFHATTLEGIRANARKTYDRHHETIREMVPPERLLEFDLKEGWGPLCAFLGKEVPKGEVGDVVPFPHVNEAAALRAKMWEFHIKHLLEASRLLTPWLIAGSVAAGAWYLKGQLW